MKKRVFLAGECSPMQWNVAFLTVKVTTTVTVKSGTANAVSKGLFTRCDFECDFFIATKELYWIQCKCSDGSIHCNNKT